jgi:hypothetical protein
MGRKESQVSAVDLDLVVPAAKLSGEDPEDTGLLRQMLVEAKGYLDAQPWCESVDESYFGIGVGGIVAAFLFKIAHASNADEWLWVVVGDLPPAYLVTDQISRPVDALSVYCDVMQRWVDAVLCGAGVDDQFPVDAPNDAEHAQMIAQRIELLRQEIIPNFG